jgi:hypothetical protein
MAENNIGIAQVHQHATEPMTHFLVRLAPLHLKGLTRRDLITPFDDGAAHGNFLSFRASHAAAIERALAAADIHADHRGDRTRLKDVCLVQCQTPFAFLMRHGGFRHDALGSVMLGLRHGAYCVGCCWALMALLFVGGVMNVLWIVLLALLVLLEKVTSSLGRLIAPVKAINEARAKAAAEAGGTAAPLESWTIHDLRRTLATGLQRLGVRLEVTDAVLNHISGSRGGIAGVYQQHNWACEKRAALDAWAAHVVAVAEQGTPVGNVVKLPRAG